VSRPAPQSEIGATTANKLVAALLQRCEFPSAQLGVTQHLNCAVSGGPDSTALLVLAVATGAQVTAHHVDHALRAGSDQEALFVAELSEGLGAEFVSLKAAVEPGGDLEARARSARREVLPADALYGHTADDQAETLMIRLMRGTGPAGLAGMRSQQHPLLGLRRSETERLCAELGVQPFCDPSNTDPRFVRNRVRHEVLPLLNSVSARDVTPLLCRLADLCAEQADLISTLAQTQDPTDAKQLAALPSPLAAEVVRLWWIRATGIGYPPDAAAIDRILCVAAGDSVSCQVSSGWSVMRSGGRLSLQQVTMSRTATVEAHE
jgi:tRNA(Ile)-lysidine synthase